MKKIDWTKLTSNKEKVSLLNEFASGNVSGDGFYSVYKGTENAGIVRTMIRDLGVTKSRQLAKRALARKGATS